MLRFSLGLVATDDVVLLVGDTPVAEDVVTQLVYGGETLQAERVAAVEQDFGGIFCAIEEAGQFRSGNGGALREEAEVGNRSVGWEVRAVAQTLGHDAEELERARVMTRLTSHECSGGSTTYYSAE